VKALIASLLLICPIATRAAEPTPVAAGYRHFYNLQYEQAIADFARYVAAAPDDPNGYNHLAEAILYRSMLRAGALETELVTGNNPFLRRAKVNASPEEQREFDENIRHAIDLAQRRLKVNSNDTGALYALGVSYGLRANYDFLVRKAWRDALRSATAADRAHRRVTELDPKNVDARMIQGLHDYVVGSLPLHWRVIGFLVGVRGNKDDGVRTVELVAKEGDRNRLDAEFLLCAIYRREKEPQRAIPLIEKLMPRFPDNYILPMELAQMYSDLGEKTKAVAVLETLRARKRAGAPGLRNLLPEKIAFAEGNIEFWYNDLDAALANMQQAAAAAENLDLNSGVLAWMRLGQIYDLKGQRPLAVSAYQHAIHFAPDSDAAKESRRYLDSPYRRKTKG
jgi:tetratricopeptide (TPR) repeat protein